MNKLVLLYLPLILSLTSVKAQENLIVNTHGRKTISLNGTWHYIIDPYETGFYDYRFKERPENDPGAYWNKPLITKKADWTEHGYKDPYTIEVPGDWNSQDRMFLYYEGTIWYQRTFDKPTVNADEDIYLYFAAVNYEAHVYLNGKKLGMHKGGFTPFNFRIPPNLLKDYDNNLVIHVNNNRHKDEIPTVNTDWWNYGGITRDVKLIITSKQFIEQYHVQLDQKQDIAKAKKKDKYLLSGWIKLNEPVTTGLISLSIPELKIKKEFQVKGDSVQIAFEVDELDLWSTENPKLYDVIFNFNKHSINDKIGFRKIEVDGTKILLNGNEIFLRGICLHEEIPDERRRAYSKKDALKMLGQVRELNANMVRLSHYPHSVFMPKMADSLGILLWTEIPVYWTIDFKNPEVLKKAQSQLKEMISRDRNRASVITWGVGNETPVSEVRTRFMSTLVKDAKKIDPTRLVAAALEVGYNRGVNYVDDPLGEYTDIVALNEYLGWYGSTPEACQTAQWKIKYSKPFFISETGAGAKGGFHDQKEMRFSEEYQQWYYEEQIKMFKNQFPESFSGVAPWILNDFRSPKRNNPEYQEGWNRKGLIDENGNKKLAFYTLQQYYKELKSKGR
ncbi:glycoside hydrolase family 2 protein [Abyssalbus ytuae]|uniref:Beta galactosidase jelly roll domain-containing protein n=1 Tax=Abyssalbus ytuae TaxID=2926907 RepID=A0A9E7CYC2_9FLAO|nr:glycoside hydrolase family 2 TIM barrel-domain containing protein [Abyssalbus ytuae]UOB16495.1 beta galactosidase jelly roll domain-containing protein [Abyssalbus ytuae]